MNEENSIPALTLDPMPAETAAAVQEAPQLQRQQKQDYDIRFYMMYPSSRNPPS